MKTLPLNGSDWTLTCYWPNQWRWRREGPDAPVVRPALPPIPAEVPGAVHVDLRRAGRLPDWNAGLNSNACEWVNNRDWAFAKHFTVPADFAGRLTLECDGLDYAGRVNVNGKLVGEFEGTHLRHTFDLTDRVAPGDTVDLEIIVFASPEVDGVFGFTSRTRLFKPRFGYYWDWCPRVVNTGIWQHLRLVARGRSQFHGLRVLPRLDEDNATGRVTLAATIGGPATKVRYALQGPDGRAVTRGEVKVADQPLEHTFVVEDVAPWWPAAEGDQPLYFLTLELLDPDGTVSDQATRTIGFKRVRWLANPGAPADARPYLCEINGRTIFLRGVNWVPLSPLYGTVCPERYQTILELYRNMNANILRVWGGAMLETPAFYDFCDRLGLLVWQEFPLSSSGIENRPPDDPAVIDKLRVIATEYIERRGHHACHLLWCGGNELQEQVEGGQMGMGKPVDESHPCMQMFAEVVERLDPGKRFLCTSPSGPRFFAAPEHFGKGLHHHTHGPWANLALAGRYAYFNGDDSLFRSEVGAPGCASLDSILRNKGSESVWPPREENPYWLHPSSAWIPWNDVTREFGPIRDDESELPFVVKASRYLQAESYRYAAEAARRRAFGLSGFIVWLGHDAAHCPANNSVIEQPGWPKPAYAWLQRAYAPLAVSLRHGRFTYRPGETLEATVWAHRPAGDGEATGAVRARLLTITGQVLREEAFDARFGAEPVVSCGAMEWPIPDMPHALFVVELALELGGERSVNRYLLSQQEEHPLGPLRTLPATLLEIRTYELLRRHRRCITMENPGAVAAVGVEIAARSSACTVLADDNYEIVLPGETRTIEFELRHTYFAGRRRTRDARLQLEWFNAAGPVPLPVAPARD